MIDNISVFEGVLRKFGFTGPVPGEIRRHASTARNRILADILREKGNYNLLLRSSLRLFYFLRGIGIRITVIQSAAAVAAAFLITAAAVVSGSYAAVKIIINDNPPAVVSGVADKFPAERRIAELDMSVKRVADAGPGGRGGGEKAVSAGDSVLSTIQKSDAVIMPAEEFNKVDISSGHRQAGLEMAGDLKKEVMAGHKGYKVNKSETAGARPFSGDAVLPAADKAAVDLKLEKENQTREKEPPDGISARDGETAVPAGKSASAYSDDNVPSAPETGVESGEADKDEFVFFASAGLSLNIPAGMFNSLASAGPSLEASFGIKDLFIKNLNPYLKTGYYIFPLREDRSKYAGVVPVFLTAAYQYIFMDKYFICPEAVFGAAFYKIDSTELSGTGGAPAGGIGLAGGYMLAGGINLNIGLRYYLLILEKEKIGFLSFGAGVEKSF